MFICRLVVPNVSDLTSRFVSEGKLGDLRVEHQTVVESSYTLSEVSQCLVGETEPTIQPLCYCSFPQRRKVVRPVRSGSKFDVWVSI